MRLDENKQLRASHPRLEAVPADDNLSSDVSDFVLFQNASSDARGTLFRSPLSLHLNVRPQACSPVLRVAVCSYVEA